MSFLAVTLPISLAIAAILLFLVLRAAREGQYDDWEGPAMRHLFDDDRNPEVEGIGPDDGLGAAPRNAEPPATAPQGRAARSP